MTAIQISCSTRLTVSLKNRDEYVPVSFEKPLKACRDIISIHDEGQVGFIIQVFLILSAC